MPRISVFCALILLLPLASCGGGSGGPAPTAATPTPEPLERSCTAESYSPNYAARLVSPDAKARLVRWTNFPLRVFFVADAQNTAERRALATQGFDKWVAATDNGATYRVVSRPDEANVTVDFYPFRGNAGDFLGSTDLSFFVASDTLNFAAIHIGITGDERNDGITATHEFGHALGIYGHSPDANDLMFLEGNDARSGQLTRADINTITTAYCGDFNRNPNARVAPDRGELKTITIR